MRPGIISLFITMVVLAGSMAVQGATMRLPASDPDGNSGITTAGEAREAGIVSLVLEYNDSTGSVAKRVGAVVSRRWANHEVIRVPRDQVEAVKAVLRLTEGVRSVEEDSVVTPPSPEPAPEPEASITTQSTSTSSPDDPQYGQQSWWRDASEHPGASGVEHAWRVSERNEKLSIVVIDGGFDNHQDFQWSGGISLVGDGRGYLSYDADTCPSYHGQSVASIIGATADNGDGMSGMVDASFYAARALACDNSGYMSDVARAIRWAAGEDIGTDSRLDRPADIVNLSLGADAQCSGSLQSAIDTANAAGVMVVASAGNSSAEASRFSPAGCDGVVTVGAVTLEGKQTSFSNHGESLEVSTLGQQVRVQGPEGHRWMSGTSFSSPIASGIIGLIRQDIPELDRGTLLQLIPSATTPFTEASDPMGAGVFNAPALQQQVAALTGTETPSLHHAMRVRSKRAEAYWEHLNETRLCDQFEFSANGRSLTSGKSFTVFEVAAGDAMTVANGEPIMASDEMSFVLSSLAPADYDYGLQFCEAGNDCADSELIPLDTTRLSRPGRCTP